MFIEQQFPVRKILKYAGLSDSCFYFKKTTDTPKNSGVKPESLRWLLEVIKFTIAK